MFLCSLRSCMRTIKGSIEFIDRVFFVCTHFDCSIVFHLVRWEMNVDFCYLSLCESGDNNDFRMKCLS